MFFSLFLLTATDGCHVQYVGSSRSGGVLCYSSVFLVTQHSLSCCLEYDRRGARDRLSSSMATQCPGNVVWTEGHCVCVCVGGWVLGWKDMAL